MTNDSRNHDDNGAVHTTGETKPLLPDHHPNQESSPADAGSASFTAADIYEQQRRSRLCLALALFSFTFALVAGLAIWKVHLAAAYRAEQYDTAKASQSLQHLNARSAKRNITAGCETTLLLLRHCEKQGPHVLDGDGNQHCSYIGYERAQFLATLFGKNDTERWPMPHHLFALTPDRGSHLNYREYETLLPLSHKAAVLTELVRRNDFAKQYFDLMMEKNGNRLCGKTVVVSFKHEYIPDLAVELGCGMENGCPSTWDELEFDQVWLLTYVFHETTMSQDWGEDDLSYIRAEEEEEPDAATGIPGQRRLKHKKKKKLGRHQKLDASSGWNVYATVTQQNFDPLAFSKQAGDYPPGGIATGANWNRVAGYGEL